MITRKRFSLGLVAVVAVFAVGLFAAGTSAQESVSTRMATMEISSYELAAANLASVPDLERIGAQEVLDRSGYEEAADFARRVMPFVHLDAAGVPRLDGSVTAARLGVSEAFLSDFEAALHFAADAIRDGRIVVNADLTVDTVGEAPAAAHGIEPAEPFGAGMLDAAIEDPSLDWQSWRYNTGAMFYNSYQSYWTHFYNRYYVLCSSMAAYIGYPWMSTNLVYFYAYNSAFFSRYLHASHGMYWFLPFSGTGCAAYQPCYCCGVSYRPVYIWILSYQYYPSCRCQQAVWGWQGFWGRY